jgi:precorrin-2 methylase
VIGNADRSQIRPEVAGRLTVIGTGIAAISHLTLEAVGQIKNANVVFYHANSGVTASYLRRLNANTVDLYEYYGEGKVRNITYVQMAELMLREVRAGKSVAGVFHGHPGYFVKAARRALAIARMEGHETRLLPGISSTDCLFADLRIDPGVIGVQILKAGHVLRKKPVLATNNHVVLVQLASVGDNTFSFSGFKHAKLDHLFEKLISIYGAHHDSVYYIAAIFPGCDPVIAVRKLGHYRDKKNQDAIKAATLYLPPKGIAIESLTEIQAFQNREVYGPFELAAIKELDAHETPAGFKDRGASQPMLRAMAQLGTDPFFEQLYRQHPDEYVSRHADLTVAERKALVSRDTGMLRQVTTVVPASPPAATSHPRPGRAMSSSRTK